MFGNIKILKNNDNVYGYVIGFDPKGSFSQPTGGTGQNVIIFRADMSSSVHANNKTKIVLILGEGIKQIYSTTLTAEKMYSINSTAARKKLCLSLHYNGDNSYLFANGTEIIKFKAKGSKIVANPVYLGNMFPDDFLADAMKKTGLYGSAFDFSVDYRVTAVDDILNIYTYLMKNE